MIGALQEDPRQIGTVERLLVQADEIAALPIVRRVYRYEDLGKHRTWRDGRAVPLEPEIQQTFALAMSDVRTAGAAAEELPVLAAACRLTGDPAVLVASALGANELLRYRQQAILTIRPIPVDEVPVPAIPDAQNVGLLGHRSRLLSSC